MAKVFDEGFRDSVARLIAQNDELDRKRFAAWMLKVDAVLLERCGMKNDGIPDYGYWDAWHVGETPLRTALRAIRAAEGF